MRSLDMDSASSTIKAVSAKLSSHGVGPLIIDRGNEQPFTTTFDHGTPYHLFISNEHYDGEHSLGFQIDPEHRPADGSQKSKIELNLVRHDDHALDRLNGGYFILKNGEGAFLGFAFKMDRALYDTPKRWVLHFQVFQCCAMELADPGQRLQPPLVLMVQPNSISTDKSLPYVLIKRNDSHAHGNAKHDNGQQLVFQDGSDHFQLERGNWYKVIFYLKPDYGERGPDGMQSNTGQIDMWLDGRHILHHIGAWGYTPELTKGTQGNYGIKLGIYRAAQDAVQRVYFDQVRWARSCSSIASVCPP